MGAKKWWNLFVEFEGEGAPAAGAGGVDLDDVDALLARTRAVTAGTGPEAAGETGPPPLPDEAPTPPAAPPRAPAAGATTALVEGRPLTEIYDEQGFVPPAPKTVEEVVRFLDGLSAMPQAVQRQALEAMDNADAEWTIEDVVVDAHNKIEALRRAAEGLETTVLAAQQRIQEELDALDQLASVATEKIDEEIASHRKQIAELEALKEQELSQAEHGRSNARKDLAATEQLCGREATRFSTEAARLQRFIDTFGPSNRGGSA